MNNKEITCNGMGEEHGHEGEFNDEEFGHYEDILEDLNEGKINNKTIMGDITK